MAHSQKSDKGRPRSTPPPLAIQIPVVADYPFSMWPLNTGERGGSSGARDAMSAESIAVEEIELILAGLERDGWVYSYEDRGERRWALTQKGWEVDAMAPER